MRLTEILKNMGIKDFGIHTETGVIQVITYPQALPDSELLRLLAKTGDPIYRKDPGDLKPRLVGCDERPL